jgi:hypothetical protein
MYWTKNGSIPSTETDGTEGWQQAPSPPTEIPEGKELVWLNWEWIIRDPKPADRAGYQWNWQHDTRSWVEGAWPNTVVESVEQLALTDLITLADSVSSVNITTSDIGVIIG